MPAYLLRKGEGKAIAIGFRSPIRAIAIAIPMLIPTPTFLAFYFHFRDRSPQFWSVANRRRMRTWLCIANGIW